MDTHLAAPARPQPEGCASAGLVLFLGLEGERTTWPALAALGAADAVLYDGAVDPHSLAVVPSHAFIEKVAAGAGGGRAKKLAAEGWRVVRLLAGGPAGSPAALAEAEELTAAGVAIRFFAGSRAAASPLPTPVPQPFATALNGLAG
jgi:hypothetical protein